MRRTLSGVLGVLCILSPAFVCAQTGAPATSATDVTAAQIQAGLKRALEELKPGVTVSDHLIGLSDIGKYNVAVAVVARPAGTFQNSLTHEKITEIYYVLKGSGTQVTGTMVDGTRSPSVSKNIGPGMSSNRPLQNSRSTKIGPGDIQVVPPGVGHGFTSIDPGGIEYLIFRVDADHVLALQ